MASSELLFSENPPAVVINEAIELTKRYQDEEAARFVNGVLDKIRLKLKFPNKSAASSSVTMQRPHSLDFILIDLITYRLPPFKELCFLIFSFSEGI